MSEKNGGPAFPCLYVKHAPGDVGNNVAIKEYGEGVTVRDYYAEKAPITVSDAMLACFVSADSIGMIDDERRAEVLAKLAEMRFEYADAMLKARNE